MSSTARSNLAAQSSAQKSRSASAKARPRKGTTPVGWVRCNPAHLQSLPVQSFPWSKKPDLYKPQSTVLQIKGAGTVYAFLCCFLRREINRTTSDYDPASLSEQRVQALPQVLDRLSTWLSFKNCRPRTVESHLQHLGRFLSWADDPAHEQRYEAVLNDPKVALQALKAHHTHLRQRLQGHQLTPHTAGQLDQRAIALLSEIHGRSYSDEIEPLEARKGQGTQAPEQDQVAQMLEMLQAVFDSAARLVLNPTLPGEDGEPRSARTLRVGSGHGDVVVLDERYSRVKVAELACVAYAGMVFIDSGANLAVLQTYEEPEDLIDQLSDPDRINLAQKAVKFRAGGKSVEVHLSATTFTRIRAFLKVRQALVQAVQSEGGGDIAPMFVQGKFAAHGSKYADPVAISQLDRSFLAALRRRISALGSKRWPVELPEVTLRQLRAHKQQDLVRRAPVQVAARLMGHSVETAINAYCKAQEATKHVEMAQYFTSLDKTVLASSVTKAIPLKDIPVGGCVAYGEPLAAAGVASLPVQPNCSKPQGCFFCDNYRLHADESDITKLLSCRRVLAPIAALSNDSVSAHRVYQAVVDRVNILLAELERREPRVYAAARVEVEERGNLSPYFARKVSQLGLLGMLDPPTASAKANP